MKSHVLARLGVAGTAAALATVGTVASFAAPAGASTVGCQNSGAFAGYCGTQVNGNGAAINVKQALAKSGQPVIGYNNVAASNSDFVWLPNGNGDGSKIAIYAPNGIPATVGGSNLCLSAPEQTGAAPVQLRDCNRNPFQSWTYDGDTGAWINKNSGDAISQSPNTTTNLLAMVPAPTTDLPATHWTFSTKAVG